MKFHGIDMRGKCYLPEKDHITEAKEERKIIYDTNEHELYFCNDSLNWIKLNSATSTDIPKDTRMWFYEDLAPTGWRVVSVAGDELLAVKGGTSTYDVSGASVVGTWDVPDHYHSLNNHVHLVSGTTSSENQGSVDQGDSGHAAHADHDHDVSITSQGPSPSDTATDGSASSWEPRPKARVGIICQKN
jgi:hypothetical protein